MTPSCASIAISESHPVSLRVESGNSTSGRPISASQPLFDSHGRQIREARISLTDRCNFRCVYCLDPGVKFMEKIQLLTTDEILRLTRILHERGVGKIRLTGGEPTLRPDLDSIIESIALMGVTDLAMTTNGSCSDPDAPKRWAKHGLSRITISLDSLEQDRLAAMTRSPVTLGDITSFVSRCREAGLGPVKMNAVIVRGFNDDEIGNFIGFARREGVTVRFIEYMPLDSGRAWARSKLVPATEILQEIGKSAELIPERARGHGETSENFVFADGADGGVGIIAPVTRPFCGECGRLRITADGKVRPCLFSHVEWDLLEALRAGETDSELAQRLADATWSKQAGHAIATPGFVQPTRSMSAIGG
jgi:cyclic pyranopterin phosphate synthase